jgi:hypothetical protein
MPTTLRPTLPGTIVFLALAGLCCFSQSSQAQAPKTASPFYALPAVGIWIEYDCVIKDQAGKETKAHLRLSRVGDMEIDGQSHAWVEVKLTTQGKEAGTSKLRKLLVSIERYRQSGDLAQSVREAYQQDGANQPVRSLAPADLASFLQLGFAGAATLKQAVAAEEELETPLGKWQCQRMQAAGKIDRRPMRYEAWLAKEVPFGLCQCTMSQEQDDGKLQLRFRATAARSGDKAQSETAAPK